MNCIVTLAFGGEQYTRFAENLAISASRLSYDTILITHSENKFDPSLFSKVINVPKIEKRQDIWALKLDLNRILDQAGIKEGRFAFVDSDSFIVKDLAPIFNVNGFYFPVESVHAPGWTWNYNTSISDLASKFCGYSGKCPQINGGFFVWEQNSDVASRWFTKAREALAFIRTQGIDREELAMSLALCAVPETHREWYDKKYVCQLWCATNEYTASIANQFAIVRMPWWDKITSPLIIHHGSDNVWSDKYWAMARDLKRQKPPNNSPSVSLVILTHARIKWLNEAVYAALHQDYKNYEILILNDNQRQELVSDNPKVRIINYNNRFGTIGEKRNEAFRQSTSDIIMYLDDDDLVTPWHISAHVENLTKHNAEVSLSTRCVSFTRSSQDIRFGGWPLDVAFKRSISTRFAPMDLGEDQDFRAKLAQNHKAATMTQTAPSYIYEWANGVHHISGCADPKIAITGYLSNMDHRLKSGEEPTGKVQITPMLQPDIAHWW